ncbi:MAG: HAMP domain-containing sensor histidine kinase [Eubacteriales bacterium]|nr:HAMP domain-containing sensor histidine kinase [Eubacteriales bacterium]
MTKRRYTIRVQFTLTFFLLMTGAIGTSLLINRTFLGRYYLKEKEKALVALYHQLDDAEEEEEEDDFSEEIIRSSDKEGIDVMVMGDDASTYKINANNENLMNGRMWDNLFSITPSIQDKQLYASDFYEVAVLENKEDYRIAIVRNVRLGTDAMELFAVLSDGSFALMRSQLESIENSSAIANRFMAYVGLIATLVGSLVAFFMVGRLTKPIRDLTEISARMKEMDFSAKYSGRSRTELADLGQNINELSETLEKTISELKTANLQLQEDIAHRDKNEEMRQEFLANVTHELKTPLALIRGYAEGLQDGIAQDPESIRYYTDVIVDETGKMNRIVQKLLTLNQLEFGVTELSMVRFDIVGFVRGCIASMQMLTDKKGIRVSMKEQRQIFVWADEFWTEEVFDNYFSNAVNHCEGEKVIDISFEQKQNCVRVTVFNTGRPIPEEAVPHLFEKFYKVDKARTREYGGSGVGLSIVKAIMEQTGCGYGLRNYDNGTAFWFELETGADLKAETEPHDETDARKD